MPNAVMSNSIEIPDTGLSLTPNTTHTNLAVRQMGGIHTNLAKIPKHGTDYTDANIHSQIDAH